MTPFEENSFADGFTPPRHLINTYFRVVHTNMPAVDPVQFAASFNGAFQMPELMSEAGETLCAVMAGEQKCANP